MTRQQRRKGDAWKHRPHHKAFYALSAAARQRALDGFRANEATTAIAAAIEKTRGETIPVGSLNRYREWWERTERPVIESWERAQALLRAFKDHPTPELESLLADFIQVVQLNALEEASKTAAPMDLAWLTVKAEKNKLERQKLEAARGAGAVDPAQLFLDWLGRLVEFLKAKDQDALAVLQPHLKAFAHTVK
jgi:hypothetical protein